MEEILQNNEEKTLSPIIQRLTMVIDAKKMSQSAFATACGIKISALNMAIKNNADLRFSTIYKIMSTYSDISAEWLIRGEGDMFGRKNDKTVTTTIYQAEQNSIAGSHISTNDAAIVAMQKQIEDQSEQIRKLTDALVAIVQK